MSTDPDKAKDEPSESESAKDESRTEAAKPAKASKSTKTTKTTASKSGAPKSASSKASSSTSSASAASPEKSAAGSDSGESGNGGATDWNLRGQMLLRGLLMILAAIAVEIAIFLLYVMTGAHFIYQLIMAKRLDRVTEFCGRLSAFSHKLLDFIGYHSDKPVFPFAPFPEASPQDDDEEQAKK